MISPYNNYVDLIKADINFWKDKTTGVLADGKIDRVRDNWLELEPIRTLSHIHNVRQILPAANLALEADALEQARGLKEQLEFTLDVLISLTKEKGHPPVLDQALAH